MSVSCLPVGISTTVITNGFINLLVCDNSEKRSREQLYNKCVDDNYVMEHDVITHIERKYKGIIIRNGKITATAKHQILNVYDKDNFNTKIET